MKISFQDIEKSEIKEYSGPTFDLEVKGDHSYNIEGVIVHNSACTTAPNTGFGTRGWQLAAVEQCANAAETSSIIADGGIRHYGDIAKSVAFGADVVMVGGFFAGHDMSPGEIIEENGERFKAFYGSASAQQKGNSKNVEGKSMLVPYKGAIADTLQTVTDSLQSSVSYVGGKVLHDLRSAQYVIVDGFK